MSSQFELYIPTNLTFGDYLAITQTARAWADGYDLKSHAHLISTLCSTIVVDYTDVNPEWGRKMYEKEEFARLWLSEEHLGNRALRTQHLLALPYFSYVGPRRIGDGCPSLPPAEAHEHGNGSLAAPIGEIEVSWQTLASHGRYNTITEVPGKQVAETSDHRAFMVQIYVKEAGLDSSGAWRLASIKPQLTYMSGNFASVRRPFDTDIKE